MPFEPTNNDTAAAIDERIVERIVKNYALRLIMTLPNYQEHFENTTFITPEGVFQWNVEIEQWTCRISAENFNASYQEFNFLLQRANEITDPEGVLSYNILTLKQLNTLDQALRLHHGDTIIGYSICEEIYLREINFLVWLFCRRSSQYDYPPLPEAYSTRLLIFISKPLMLDVVASLRVATQSLLLFWFFLIAYFQYTPRNDDDYLQFYGNNTPWILLSLSCVIVLCLLLLRNNHIDKSYVLSSLVRLRWIEQSVIGMISNLINYAPLLVKTSAIKTSFLPFIVLAGFVGYYKSSKNKINIAQLTNFQFLFRIFFLALTTGSFCALGLSGLINAIFFTYAHDNTAVQEKFFQDQSFVRYITFAIMLFALVFRFPNASLRSQHFGRYASNWMNGIGITLLDNYSLYLLMSDLIVTLYGRFTGSDDFSPDKPVAPAFLWAMTALSLPVVFLVTFPTTPNLPEYSLEKNPIKPTWITKALRFFNDATTHCCMVRTEDEVSPTRSISSVGIEFVSKSITSFSRALGVNQFYPSAGIEEIPPVENPLQKNNDHVVSEEKNALGF